MPSLSLTAKAQNWPLAKPFRISRGVKTAADTVIAELSDGTHIGRGECTPYPRYGESVESVLEQLETVAKHPDSLADAGALQTALPPGAARNALDCAFHDFTAKQTGTPVADRISIALSPVETAFTLSLDTPDIMFEAARAASHRPVLKIKLGGDGDADRLEAVRRGSPDAKLIVDANEGWTSDQWDDHLTACINAKVGLIEQPLPAGDDDALLEIKSPIPLCADESIHTRQELAHVAARYDAVNVKLDKTGGLTEAIALCEEAREHGLIIMVGCMVASSLAMAPALMIAQGAEWVDLDGPLLLAEDCDHALTFDGSTIHPADRALWG
ncbi:MAG: N-acetyl-D-Glu racemase DgcA [Pseudomonadota bacterium]